MSISLRKYNDFSFQYNLVPKISDLMKPLRLHYLQHVPFEDLGYIQEWALQNGHTVTSTKFYESFTLPEITEIDGLIIMGGPMGVQDEDKYDWLIPEKQFIKEVIQAQKPVLGICLGSQLIAEVLGATVFPNQEKEIGWFPISLTEIAQKNPFASILEASFDVFHWHGDTFDLPKNAIHLMRSEGCENQAFLYQNRVLGLQFHLEVTAESVQKMVHHGKHELIPTKYIQTENTILETSQFLTANNQKMAQILNVLFAQ